MTTASHETGQLRALLIGGAVAAAVFNVVPAYVSGWPGPSAPGRTLYVIDSTVVLLAYLLVGVIAGAHHPRQRVGLLFTVVGYAWLLPQLISLYYALPFTIGNLTASLYQAALAHLALAWPYGRLRSRLDRAVVVGIYAWNLISAAAGLLVWNPATNGCTNCPKNLLLDHSATGAMHTVGWITTAVGVLTTLITIALVAQHWRSGRGYARAAMTRLIWVATPIAAYIIALNIISGFNLTASTLWVYDLGPLILVAPPVAYAVGMLRARSARAAVGVALVDLEPGPAPERLLDALARALGDPSLQLASRTPGPSGHPDGVGPDVADYVDTAGRPVQLDALPPGRMLTHLDPAGQHVLILDVDLRHEPDLVRVTAAAAAQALEHARLRAEIEHQLDQVSRSRTRIVEAADAARRRLERDLHDGAQQRLVTLSLALGMARNRAAGSDPELDSLLESATKEAKEALVELRELARGIHPAVLTESGLSGAVQALVERSPVTTLLIALPDERFPSPVEATAYFIVSEALANIAKHAPTATAQITIRQEADHLMLEVSDDGPGGARPEGGSGLRGLADRVASVGGVLQINSPPGGGTRLYAEVPNP